MKPSACKLLALAGLLVLASVVHAQEPPGHEERTTPDGRFTIEAEIERLPVTSQDATGTCWSFATVSFLESELERLHGKPANLSEIYPVYFAYLEKARRYVRLRGKAQFSEGGLCHDVIEMVRRHGIVPERDYSGLVDGDTRHRHGEMAGLLEAMVEQLAKSKRPGRKWEAAIRGVLDAYIGKVPDEVEVDGQKMTPRQYARDVLKIPFGDYVQLMSFSYLPFWEEGELLVPDNWMRYQDYLNVPVEAMMDSLDHAIRQGYSVAADMDVSEKGFRMQRGVAKLTPELEREGAVTDQLRERLFDDRKTTDDHLMHVVGIAKDAGGKTYYLTKNSWGPVGTYKGYILMSRNYVALKMLSFMAHKDGIPKDVLDKVQP